MKNLILKSLQIQGRRNRGGQGGRGPPKVYQNQYSKGLSSASASEGILALAPPNIFTFRRPCAKRNGSVTRLLLSSTLFHFFK